MRKAKPIQVWKCTCGCDQWFVEYERISGMTTKVYTTFAEAIFRAGQEEAHMKEAAHERATRQGV